VDGVLRHVGGVEWSTYRRPTLPRGSYLGRLCAECPGRRRAPGRPPSLNSALALVSKAKFLKFEIAP
jgi:hypothetical protein